MASLRETQIAFANAVLFGDASSIAPLIVDNGIEAGERVQIYRNNVRLGFLAALEATFPVVRQLGGDDWFAQTAHQYQQAHPSASGDLQYVGRSFAEYLTTELQDGNYAYFADVARLEWAYQEVLVAAEDDASLNNIADLASVSPDSYGSLQFHLPSALRLVAASTPIFSLWQAHQPGNDAVEPVDLHAGAQRVLIIRRGSHVELRQLTLGEFVFLDALTQHQGLEAALLQALDADDSLEVATILPRMTQLGVLTRFTTPI